MLNNAIIVYEKLRGGFMTFSEQIKSVRAKLLLSQEQLADKLGVSYVTISRWESKGIEPSFLTRAKFNKFCEENGIILDSDK